MEIVFFGNERIATATTTNAPVLRALVEHGYKIEAVISTYTDVVSRQKRGLEIGQIAHDYGIPVILPGKTIQLADKVRRHQTDAAVLIAYGRIIPREVINLFPKGIINIHPSLLPKLRGPTPVETAILSGLKETGVSLMKLSARMDAGPVYAQNKVKLTGNETKFELAERLNKIGADLLIYNLEAILNGSLKPKFQDETKATYTKMISKSDGLIDWSKSAEQIECEIRAYTGWPGSQTVLGNKEVIITKASIDASSLKPGIIKIDKNKILVGTGQRSLSIERLKPAGKREMTAQEYLAGNKIV